MDTRTLLDLYKHMEWADSKVWAAVLASVEAKRDVPLRKLLYHLHKVQYAFLRTWRAEPREAPYPTFEDLLPLSAWGRDYYRQGLAWVGAISAADLSQPMPLAWAGMVERKLGRAPDVTTLGDTALQVPLHSLYHRAQVNARLREIGGEPPLVDYIAWVWGGRPAPEWPVESVANAPT
ncbi:MAG: damage-inducible protein DinB [Acidobacteriota bacterium]